MENLCFVCLAFQLSPKATCVHLGGNSEVRIVDGLASDVGRCPKVAVLTVAAQDVGRVKPFRREPSEIRCVCVPNFMGQVSSFGIWVF